MKKTPWVVFSDLDGTLGIEGRQIPLRNRQAIRRFVEKGGQFGICTGRSPDSAREFLQDIPVNAPSVVNGGCALYNFDTGELTQEKLLPESSLLPAERLAEEFPESSLVVVNRRGYWQIPKGGMEPRYPEATLDSLERPFYRIILMAPPEQTEVIARRAREQFIPGVRIERTAPDFVEIMNEDAGKLEALERLCRVNGLPLERVAFIGDFYNDLELMRHAGLSACVSEAPREVQSQCALVLSGCMDGAVADFLEALAR